MHHGTFTVTGLCLEIVLSSQSQPFLAKLFYNNFNLIKLTALFFQF